MQQTLSLNTPNTAPLTREKLAKMSSELKEKEAGKGSDFLTLMLTQLSASATKKEGVALPIATNQPSKIEPKLETSGIEDIASLEVEKATFVQILQLLETLNNGKETLAFPKLTQKLENLLAQEGILKEFKEVKSLQDLLILSKKYDLGLEKITLSTQEVKTLESFFPKLAEKSFFEPKKETIASETLLKSKQSEPTQKPQQDDATSLRDLLRTVETKKDEKKDYQRPVATETKVEVKGEVKTEVKPETKTDIKPEVKSEVKTELKPEVKTELKPEVKPEEKTKQSPKEVFGDKSNLEVKGEVKGALDKEMRAESPRVQTPLTPSIDKEPTPSTVKDSTFKTLFELSQGETKGGEKESSTQEGETRHQSAFSKEVGKQQQTQRDPQLRQTFNTFAQDFKEQVENYKPPMMKIQLALNPKNLGEVDVTLINRGNNLHVSFTSNTSQTLSLFVQNQAEFKNALVNMGFTNLEMNFSQKERQEHQHGNASKGEFFSEEDNFEEETALELILPNYV